jgi:hypothetical protein
MKAKPTILLGLTGVGGIFTEDVIKVSLYFSKNVNTNTNLIRESEIQRERVCV